MREYRYSLILRYKKGRDEIMINDNFSVLLKENYAYISIKGLGNICIKRTHEGVIIDVLEINPYESIDSMAIENNEFSTLFIDGVTKKVEALGSNIEVDDDLLEKWYSNGLTVDEAVQRLIDGVLLDIDVLEPLRGCSQELNIGPVDLTNPFLVITKEEHRQLFMGESSFYKTDKGSVVTSGNDRLGYALIPLSMEAAAKVIANQ
jgi:hypothetical protein